jgi:hypothetical protein
MLHTHLSVRAGTINQLVAEVPSGLSLTSPQEIKKYINMIGFIYFHFLLCGYKYISELETVTEISLGKFHLFLIPGNEYLIYVSIGCVIQR